MRVDVPYGADVPDPGERKYNRLTAEWVGEALEYLGHSPHLIPLTEGSDTPVGEEAPVFNLCDSDSDGQRPCRHALASFALELEQDGRAFTGSRGSTLRLASEKTLAWVPAEDRPEFWDKVPAGQQYIVKPRNTHGSLLITEANVNGDPDAFDSSYFYQALLEGPEYSVCLLGVEVLGSSKLHDSGIITRDDKWNDTLVTDPPKRRWTHSPESAPDGAIWELARKTWARMLEGKSQEEMADWLNKNQSSLFVDAENNLVRDNFYHFSPEEIKEMIENEEETENVVDEDIITLGEFWSDAEVLHDKIKNEQRFLVVSS